MNPSTPESHIYYFQVGNGNWQGKFSFRVSDWRGFWRDRVGLKNRFLVLGMVLVQKLLGSPVILSTLRAFPEWGPNGVATNEVRIKKLGTTIYLLRERYVLHPDGRGVFVHSRERFGPLPFLFRSSKRHPARIHEGGRGATYLDMPLVGTLWEGRYTVLADLDHIDADLTCAWASAREVIARRGDRSPASRTAPPGRHLATLEQVVKELETQRDWYEAVRDRRAVFCHAYATITEVFRNEIPQRGLRDRDWIVRLDLAFAREYFGALDHYDLGSGEAPGWQAAFEAMAGGRTSVVEELILSMAVHIVHDLPMALRQVGLDAGEASRIGDYQRVNDILEVAIDRIQSTVGRRYNPYLRWLDRAGHREDEVLTNYGIRLARAAAWFNGARLLAPEGEDATRASLARSTSILVKNLLRPPLASARLVLRLARWLSRLVRVWPARRVV